MSKEEIIKAINDIDEEVQKNREIGAVYIPTTRSLVSIRKIYVDMLWHNYGILYV